VIKYSLIVGVLTLFLGCFSTAYAFEFDNSSTAVNVLNSGFADSPPSWTRVGEGDDSYLRSIQIKTSLNNVAWQVYVQRYSDSGYSGGGTTIGYQLFATSTSSGSVYTFDLTAFVVSGTPQEGILLESGYWYEIRALPLYVAQGDYDLYNWYAVNTAGVTHNYTSYLVTSSDFVYSSGSLLYTRLISTDPLNKETVSTTTSIGATFSVSSEDWSEDAYLDISYQSTFASSGYYAGVVVPQEYHETFAVDPGMNWVSTTTTFLKPGGYTVRWKLIAPSWLSSFSLGLLNGRELFASSTVLYVGYKSGNDIIEESLVEAVNRVGSATGVIASSTASSTSSFVQDCNIFGFSTFNLGQCLTVLFVPNKSQMQLLLEKVQTGFLTKFPLGYVTDFVTILATSTVVSIPSITATVPEALPGHGSVVTLGVSSSTLSWLYESTSGEFSGSSQTFYDFTYYYWRIIVVLSLLFYLLMRILGSHLIAFHKKQ